MEFNNANGAFDQLFGLISKQPPTDNGTKLMYNVSITINNPEDNKIVVPYRNWKPSYAELEYKWYKTGNKNPAMVEAVAKIWTGMKNILGEVNSNYGYWWHRNNQLVRVIRILTKDSTSRRAVIIHYDVDDMGNYAKDTPCNLCIQFYIADGTLNMTVFARSIDLVYGFCNDQYCFSELQKEVAEALALPVGIFHYFITNLHIYKKHYDLKSKQI